MPTHAISADYHGDIKDAREKFFGNIVVYVGWEHHLLFCASKAYPLAPTMHFSALLEQIIPDAFAQHPEFTRIDWSRVQWLLDGEPFIPAMDKSLADQGIAHKSLLRFATPELTGYEGAGI